MFNQNIHRIGFACKISKKSNNTVVSIPEYNFKSTTISWLSRQSKQVAEQKLWELLEHNLTALHNSIIFISKLPNNLRMFRIGSDCLPAYTHKDYQYFWKQTDVIQHCQSKLYQIGLIAKQNDIRLSMHPGQFTVLASDNPDIVTNSIKEFEYHADIVRWLGYGQVFQDFKINVHISGKQGPQGIKKAITQLSNEARNCITIENDENKWGINDSLELVNDCALVLDIHHTWCREGEYFYPSDDRFSRIIDSWRGVRPVIHYSYSRNEHLPNNFNHDSMPDMAHLLEAGHKKAKLRAHSDRYPNSVVNEYALSFLEYADIMAEVKFKNIASLELYKSSKLSKINS